jgi:hypothetical protein
LQNDNEQLATTYIDNPPSSNANQVTLSRNVIRQQNQGLGLMEEGSYEVSNHNPPSVPPFFMYCEASIIKLEMCARSICHLY